MSLPSLIHVASELFILLRENVKWNRWEYFIILSVKSKYHSIDSIQSIELQIFLLIWINGHGMRQHYCEICTLMRYTSHLMGFSNRCKHKRADFSAKRARCRRDRERKREKKECFEWCISLFNRTSLLLWFRWIIMALMAVNFSYFQTKRVAKG